MLGNLISAGASLIGGLLGNKSQKDANEDNYKGQKEFAQNSVQWRAADAKKAGISPLFALGMSPVSYSPSSVGDTSLSSAMSSMGQDVGRAVSAATGPQGRLDATVQALTIKRMGLENDLLASQIAKINQPGNPPGIGSNHIIPGQGDAPILEVKNPQRTGSYTDRHGNLHPTAKTMDAQTAQDRWGEVMETIHGVQNYLMDKFPGWYRVMDHSVARHPNVQYDGRDVTGGLPY